MDVTAAEAAEVTSRVEVRLQSEATSAMAEEKPLRLVNGQLLHCLPVSFFLFYRVVPNHQRSPRWEVR